MAGPGRRLLGISIDWAVALVVSAALLGGGAVWPLAVLLVEHTLLVATLGAGIGHRLAGLAVERVDGAAVGPLRALGRSVLLCLVIPALVWDQDGRGLHDRLVGTVVVRW